MMKPINEGGVTSPAMSTPSGRSKSPKSVITEATEASSSGGSPRSPPLPLSVQGSPLPPLPSPLPSPTSPRTPFRKRDDSSGARSVRRGIRLVTSTLIVAATAVLLTGLYVNSVRDFSCTRAASSLAASVFGTPVTAATAPAFGLPRATQDPDPDAPWPRVAWLMSFPNSGTSYTMRLVQRLSDRTGASNYGRECDDMSDKGDEKHIPVHPEISKNGPFLANPKTRAAPDRYILTKTHCGGYTTDSGPSKYIETLLSFKSKCRTSDMWVTEKNDDGEKEEKKVILQYPESLVQRAVHIVRDPFNNAVSRFHLEQHEHEREKDVTWLSKFPSTPRGFQRWCQDLDETYAEDEASARLLDDDMRELFDRVPCHAEFFRYIQWHNLAQETTHSLRLPTLVMYYEDYTLRYNETVDELFEFLELPRDGKLPSFHSGKTYHSFFTRQQQLDAIELMKAVATPESWMLLDRYVRPIQEEAMAVSE